MSPFGDSQTVPLNLNFITRFTPTWEGMEIESWRLGLCVAFWDCGTVSHEAFTKSRVKWWPEGQAGPKAAKLWPYGEANCRTDHWDELSPLYMPTLTKALCLNSPHQRTRTLMMCCSKGRPLRAFAQVHVLDLAPVEKASLGCRALLASIERAPRLNRRC